MFNGAVRAFSLLVVLLGSQMFTSVCLASGDNTATISGTITEAANGTPIEGATVAVGILSGGLHVGTTDASGNYSISMPVSSGGMEVMVEAASATHAPARYDFAGEAFCYFSCTPIGGEFTINPGEAVTGIDISLDEGGTLSGSVAHADTGVPAEDARIELTTQEGYNYSDHFEAVTGSDGTYSQPIALPAGTYFIKAAPADGDNLVTAAWNGYPCEYSKCPILDTDPVEIEAGVHQTGFDFALEPGARISGELYPDDIERIVRVFNGAGIFLDTKVFWADDLPASEWSFDGLSGGSYYIELGPLIAPTLHGGSPRIRILHNGRLCPYGGCNRASGVPITIPADSSLSLSQIDLPLGGQIEGAIVDASTGSSPAIPAGSILDLYDVIDSEGTVVGGGTIREQDGDLVMAESSGLPPGDYFVRTYHSFSGAGIGYDHPGFNHDVLAGYVDAMYPDVACAGLACDMSQAAAVTVTSGNTTEITVEVSAGSDISGTVVDDTTGSPVDNAFVKLVDAGNTLYATAITDDGEFEFGAFPAGTYYLRTSMSAQTFGFNPHQNPYFDKIHGAPGRCSEQLCDPEEGDEIVLDGTSDAGPFELRVEPGPVIHGHIIFDLTGLIINNGHVEVYDEADRLVGVYGIDRSTGEYQTTALEPGDYRLVPIVSPAYSDVSTPSGRLSAGQSGQGLVVTMGTEDVQADLEMTDNGLDLLFRDQFEAF